MSMWIKIVSSSLLIWLSKLLFCTVWKRSLNIGKIIVKPLEISNANQHIEGAASHTVQQYTMNPWKRCQRPTALTGDYRHDDTRKAKGITHARSCDEGAQSLHCTRPTCMIWVTATPIDWLLAWRVLVKNITRLFCYKNTFRNYSKSIYLILYKY